MPVRWKSKKGRRARVAVTLDAAIGAIEGTVSAASVYTGRIQGLVYDFTGALTGVFVQTSAVAGSIFTQLDHFGGTIYGSEDYPAVWSDGLSNEVPLVSGEPFSYTFTATDPDGDPIEFTWDADLVPSWLTITALPQVGNSRDLVMSSITGAPEPDPPTIPDSYTVAVRLQATNAAETDWQRRLAAANVNGSLQWYHRFESETEVTKFQDSATLARGKCLWSATGGPQGQGCIRHIVPANPDNIADSYYNAGGNGISRPFTPQPGDPAYVSSYPTYNPNYVYQHGYYGHPDYHADSKWLGHEYWLSMKMYVDRRRWSSPYKDGGQGSIPPATMQAAAWVTPNPATVFVHPDYGLCYVGGKGACWVVTDTDITQEITIGPASRGYQLAASSNRGAYPFGETRNVSGTNYYYPQANGAFDPTCDANVNALGLPSNGIMQAYKCYRYPSFYNWYLGTNHPEWHTYMIRVKLGHQGAADTLVEFYVCEDDGVWKRVFRHTNLTFPYVGGTFPFGHSRVQLACYMNNSWFRDGMEQRFTDVIFKKADPNTPSEADPEVWGIPAPAAGL